MDSFFIFVKNKKGNHQITTNTESNQIITIRIVDIPATENKAYDIVIIAIDVTQEKATKFY